MTACTRRPRSYWTTCHCDDCVRERRRTRKLHSTGRQWRVPSEVAWEVLAAKIDEGWTALAISSATGLPESLFGDHLARYRKDGNRRYLSPATAKAIIEMERPTKGQVGAERSRRRLRALAAIGWALDDLAAETGIGASTLGMIRGTNQRIRAEVANTIADAYDRLHMTPGPNASAARQAREKGWPPPLAFDNIDDLRENPRPAHVPLAVDPIVVERILAGDWRLKATPAERAEVVARWTGGLNQLERRTGWNIARDKRQESAA